MRRGDITQVINGHASGPDADVTMSEIYHQLRHCVAGILAGECRNGPGPHAGQDLTMVVHECWLKLQRTPHWDNRAHFFGAASRATRQILIDMARSRKRRPAPRVYLDGIDHGQSPTTTQSDMAETAARVDAALNGLAEIAPRAARIGGYRLFGDLPSEMIAEIEGVDVRTVQRDWKFARAWLASRLDPGHSAPPLLSIVSPISDSHA